MYLRHFGLNEFPFSITPDTDYFFSTRESQQALNTLLVAVMAGEGFIKITGEVGTGKTLICRQLIKVLGSGYKVAYVLNPYRQPMSLFMELCSELEAPLNLERTPDEYVVLDTLVARVIELSQQKKRVLICLDEVQAMPTETLEALRLITNLETNKRKLMQVIIFGQPELDEKLDHPSIRQLKQRITFQYRLRPMEVDQLGRYVRHRLLIAGHPHGDVFSPDAIKALAYASRCVPRLVNILASKSLLSAFAEKRTEVQRQDVLLAAQDTESAVQVSRRSWRSWLPWLASTCLVVLVVLAGYFSVWMS